MDVLNTYNINSISTQPNNTSLNKCFKEKVLSKHELNQTNNNFNKNISFTNYNTFYSNTSHKELKLKKNVNDIIKIQSKNPYYFPKENSNLFDLREVKTKEKNIKKLLKRNKSAALSHTLHLIKANNKYSVNNVPFLRTQADFERNTNLLNKDFDKYLNTNEKRSIKNILNITTKYNNNSNELNSKKELKFYKENKKEDIKYLTNMENFSKTNRDFNSFDINITKYYNNFNSNHVYTVNYNIEKRNKIKPMSSCKSNLTGTIINSKLKNSFVNNNNNTNMDYDFLSTFNKEDKFSNEYKHYKENLTAIKDYNKTTSSKDYSILKDKINRLSKNRNSIKGFVDETRELILMKYTISVKEERKKRLTETYANEIESINDVINSMKEAKILFNNSFFIQFLEYCKYCNDQKEREKNKLIKKIDEKKKLDLNIKDFDNTKDNLKEKIKIYEEYRNFIICIKEKILMKDLKEIIDCNDFKALSAIHNNNNYSGSSVKRRSNVIGNTGNFNSLYLTELNNVTNIPSINYNSSRKSTFEFKGHLRPNAINNTQNPFSNPGFYNISNNIINNDKQDKYNLNINTTKSYYQNNGPSCKNNNAINNIVISHNTKNTRKNTSTISIKNKKSNINTRTKSNERKKRIFEYINYNNPIFNNDNELIEEFDLLNKDIIVKLAKFNETNSLVADTNKEYYTISTKNKESIINYTDNYNKILTRVKTLKEKNMKMKVLKEEYSNSINYINKNSNNIPLIESNNNLINNFKKNNINNSSTKSMNDVYCKIDIVFKTCLINFPKFTENYRKTDSLLNDNKEYLTKLQIIEMCLNDVKERYKILENTKELKNDLKKIKAKLEENKKKRASDKQSEYIKNKQEKLKKDIIERNNRVVFKNKREVTKRMKPKEVLKKINENIEEDSTNKLFEKLISYGDD